MWTIYYNGDCSKSRAAREFLISNGIEFTTVNYLEGMLTADDIQALYTLIGGDLDAMVRMGEDEFKVIEGSWHSLSAPEKFIFIAENPRVLQRPIVSNGKKAVIARPTADLIAALID